MKLQRISSAIIAVLFTAALFAFAAADIYAKREVLLTRLSEFTEVSSVDDIKSRIAGFEGTLNEEVWEKMKFVELYSFLHVLAAKEENGGFDIIRAKDGNLNYGDFFPIKATELMDFQEYALRISRLRDYAAERGAKTFFVSTVTNTIPPYSPGLYSYDSRRAATALLYYLQGYGVNYLNLGVAAQYHGISDDNFYYKTDHHWRIETVFAAFNDIIGYMNDNYGSNLDPDGFYRDINNYKQYKYKNAFLGSLGRRSGVNFSGLDDFTLIVPNFEISYKYQDISPYKEPKYGSFEVLLSDWSFGDNPYQRDFYSVYGNIRAYTTIRNNDNPDAPKLLLIRDSYLIPLADFMAPMFSEIHMLWPFSDIGGTPDIEQFLKDNTFDYVIIEYAGVNIRKENGYDFFKTPKSEEQID
jgi:hypothetical protein